MKVIIAGGRAYRLTGQDLQKLNELHESYGFTEVVSGKCPTGADRGGELWADSVGLPVRPFPADWGKHGKAAGPIRNSEMAQYADAVILFPGGKGTESMEFLAWKHGLESLYVKKVSPLVAAAIKGPDEKIYTGRRHAEIIGKAEEYGLPWDGFKGCIQGFVDDQGVFFNRIKSAEIAFKAGQTEKVLITLTSEDLW